MRYNELLESHAMVHGKPVLLIKNPPASVAFFHVEGFAKGIGRGIVVNGDVFLFDAYLASHADVEEEHFHMHPTDDGFDLVDHDGHFVFTAREKAMRHLVEYPNLRRILGDPRVLIARENGDMQTLDQFEKHEGLSG